MNRVRRAIIMAAGYGNRMLPITRNIPKPLIKVNGTAMIETIIELFWQITLRKYILWWDI